MTESISLFYKDGSSDKVYNAEIKKISNRTGPDDKAFVVNFEYGRRGSTLTSGTKTTSPVDFLTAKKVYEKLVREKIAKGYKPDVNYKILSTTIDNGPSANLMKFQALSDEKKDMGIHPQLLNPIEESEVDRLIGDRTFVMQQKHDGRRLLIKKEGSKVIGINRKGQEVPLRKELIDQLALHPESFILDGEDCGDTFWVFDCLGKGKEDWTDAGTAIGFDYRFKQAAQFVLDSQIQMQHAPVDCKQGGMILLSPLAKSDVEKRQMYNRLKKENAEGVVFKHYCSRYVAGRPNSGGSQLKFKFVATTTCKVTSQNGTKRSVALEMKDGTNIGNVTIPANFSIPKTGELVEIRYLYAYKGGSLYQPVYLGVRDDLDNADTTESLKFKPEGMEDE